MKTRTKIALVVGVVILALAAGLFGYWHHFRQQSNQSTEEIEQNIVKEQNQEEKTTKRTVCVEKLSFARLSDREIQIQWPDQWDPYVKEYQIERQIVGTDDWTIVGTLDSDQIAEEQTLTWIDPLENDVVQQYEYRVNVTVSNPDQYRAENGETIIASNLLLCIDPGHYAGRNAIEIEPTYIEGDFTLQLAKELVRVLEEQYGVTSILTRDTDHISIGGFTDRELDLKHISLRGEYAKGTDLFLSLHTNANQDEANGYPTLEQPTSINKPILILNEIACGDVQIMEVANEIGSRLAETNYQLGIATVSGFLQVHTEKEIPEWTDAFNDGIDIEGTVCRRTWENGDYYGVLRGAASVGVPGIIVEHGFHTVPEMRKLAATGELATRWAEADAEGIAEGFGLKKK